MQPFTKTFKKGITLFHENDYSRELYLIQSGSVKVYRKINNREIELAVISKGAVLGEMALIDGKPRSASAIALEDSSVIIISADTFHEKISGVPAWFMCIIRTTCEKIRKANARLDYTAQQGHELSVALSLKYLFLRYATTVENQKALDLKFALHRLTTLLCASHQRVMAVFEFLHNARLVTVHGNFIFVRSEEGLSDYCLFLRACARKAFDTVAAISPDAKKALACLRKRIALGDLSLKRQTKFTADELSVALAECEPNSMKAVETLETLGIVSRSKSSAETPAHASFAGCEFTIDNAAFEKHFLWCTFNATARAL